MQRLIEKRAADSDLTVDPQAIVDVLTQEGLLDDRRYVENRISILSGSHHSKGPGEIKNKLATQGGIPGELVDEFLQSNDPKWFELAAQIRDKALSAKGLVRGPAGEVPEKFFHSLKQKLQRKGFTAQQIHHTLKDLVPIRQKNTPVAGDISRQVAKLKSAGKGPIAILHHLRQKGYDEPLIRQQLETEDDSWVDLARFHLKKQFKETQIKTMKERKKRTDWLLRRGFTMDQVRCVLNDS
jgi:SOS response regulatory protein OraA/RecX